MGFSLKDSLCSRLAQAGAFDTRVADPAAGFEHSAEGMHPLDLWPGCRSIVVFAVAHSSMTNNIYAGPFSPFEGDRQLGPMPSFIADPRFALERLSRLFVSSIRLKGISFLEEAGWRTSTRFPQLKLAACEAGLGVYGRSGVLIHPVLGSRFSLGAIMTDAPMEPDGRLEGFDPCGSCTECAKACPAHAIDGGRRYPDSWSREKCLEKRAEVDSLGLYCNNCFASCPAGRIPDEDLLSIRKADSLMKRQRFSLEIRSSERGGDDGKPAAKA